MSRQRASRPYVHAEAEEAAGRMIVLRPCLAAVEAYALTTDRDWLPVDILEAATGFRWKLLAPTLHLDGYRRRWVHVRHRVRTARVIPLAEVLVYLRSEVARLDALLFGAEREDSVAEVGLVSALELRALLRRMRWSQARMARALDVKPAQMHQWCRGVKPVPEWVGRLAKWLEVDEAG